MITVSLGDSSMGIDFSKYLELPKIKSFRITIPGLDTKELIEMLTRCLGKLGRFPRKMGHPCVKQSSGSREARTNKWNYFKHHPTLSVPEMVNICFSATASCYHMETGYQSS